MSDESPVIEVVRGSVTEEEAAALVIALRSTSAAPAQQAPVVTSAWADRSHGLRTPLCPGPDAWRRS